MGMDRDIEHWGLLGLPTCRRGGDGCGKGGVKFRNRPLEISDEYTENTLRYHNFKGVTL